MTDTPTKNPETTLQTGLSSLATNVPNRTADSYSKTGPPRSTPYETDTALETQFEGHRITRKYDQYPKVTPPPLKVMASGRKHSSRPTIAPPQACSANLYGCIKKRMGCSQRETHCKGKLVPSGKQVAHKVPGTKGCLLGPKEFQDLCSSQTVLIATDIPQWLPTETRKEA